MCTGWLRSGDLSGLSMHHAPRRMIGPDIAGIAEPPVAHLSVQGALKDILSRWGRDTPFEARAYMADREIQLPYLFVRSYEIVFSDAVSVNLETLVTSERVKVHPWRQGMRLD